MNNLVFKSLEKILNAYLKLDPETFARLLSYQGKTAKLKLTDLKLDIYLQITASGFELSPHSSSMPDTSIEGSSFDLLKMASRTDAQSNLISSGIKLSGDLDFGQNLYKTLKDIDIDWEEHLSKLVGDNLAYPIMQQARSALKWLKRSSSLLNANTQEFIHEEIRLAPSRSEVEDFYHDIAVLRDDVERLEQRIMQLINSSKES